MPANLTPEYEKAELRYRQAMLAAISKHKRTEKIPAALKRRLS